MTVLNFAAETVFEANTTSGNVSLTRTQLESLVDGNYTTGGVTLSGTDILALDVDLGNRIATKDLRYYFSSPFSTAAVASGISFYYRDYTTDPWSLLTTTYGAGYYTTTSGNFFPHQVRVVHTISGTSISGTVREYEVNSNEDIVDYGDDGSLTEKGLTDTPFGTSDPYTIPVYNDGDKSATAYVYIGNTSTDADDMLRISDAQAGTYIGVDDGPLIGGDGYSWGLGSYSNTALDNNKLVLGDAGGASYSSGWENIGTTLDNNCRPAGIAWHPTDPWQSVLFYIRNQTMYKYELATGVHVSVGATPRNTSSDNRGGNNDLVYDPVGNRMYYFVWDDIGGNYDHLYCYYYDLDTGLWSGVIVDWDYDNDARLFSIRGAFFEYPGTTNSKDTLFEVGERYIVVTISSGHSTVYRNYRLRLSDHDWSLIPQTGYLKHTGDANENFRATGVCMQLDNLDDYAGGTVAVIWSYAGSSDEYEYINAYAITDQTGAAQTWSPTRIYNISPRDPSIDSWFINQDFLGRGKFFFYDESADKLYFASDYSNNAYAVWYNVGGGNLGEGTYRLYRYYIAATNFFDSNWQNAYLYGDAKRYDDGLFWFMARLENEQLWMQFPTNWSNTVYETEGTYTTPILKNQDPTYWYVKSEIPENTQIATTSGVVASTIEVRSSNTAPEAEDSHYYVIFVNDGSNNIRPTAYDYNGNILWQDSSLSDFWYTEFYWRGGEMAMNKHYPSTDTSYDVNTFAIWTVHRVNEYNLFKILIFNRGGGVTYSREINYDNNGNADNYWHPTCSVINSLGQTYVGYRGLGTFDDRLAVHTDTGWWIQTVDFTGDQSTIYRLCLAGEEKEDLWFIKEDENTIYRYTPNLVEVTSVSTPTFQNANGLCEDGEGGFWVGDYGNGSTWIRHYDKDGTHVATYDVSAHVQVVAQLRPDYYGGVWLLDTWGDQVARFASNGTFIGKATLLSPRALDSTPLGAHVMSQTYDRVYFLDINANLEKTIYGDFYDSYSGSNWRGAAASSVDVSGYLDTDYIGNDPHWGSGGDLEWNEVSKDTNFVHHQLYHQARITLRGDGSDTPEVEKIALPPTVQLTNIAPQGYKNSYLKTVVASGTVRSQQSGKLRTWFSLEE